MNNRSSKAFTLKGGLYPLTTLHIESNNLEAITQQLADAVKQAPKFFDNTPVVVDFQAIVNATTRLDMEDLANCLREHRLIPVGLRGANEKQREAAIAAGWVILPEAHRSSVSENNTESSTKTSKPSSLSAMKKTGTKLITQPVRSGQQIYAQESDLIVLAPVSAGAEIMADGHIHVYAPLRGRALAGVKGNTDARIFCQQLAAELIAIAGHYKVSDQLKNQISSWGKSAVIYLTDDHLTIQPL